MLQRAAVTIALISIASLPHALALDTSSIEKATGMKGTYHATENVYTVSKPRANMAAVDGWKIPPFLGTSSHVAFSHLGYDQVMVMGHNVLFEDEVGPTMSAALENGLEVTALHNLFLFEQPQLFSMHMSGLGYADKLATAVKKVLDAPEQVRSRQATPATKYAAGPVPAENRISVEPLERILGRKGEANNGMLKVSYGRPVKVNGTTIGTKMGNTMGVNTWAGFAGTDDQAVVNGNFAVLEIELQPVLKLLINSGINIVGIHQHMTQEVPRLLFLQYWGQGKAPELARAVRAAINLTGTKVRS
jgi:hypothetical protein